MKYEPEISPGRSHEHLPTENDVLTARSLGALALYMANEPTYTPSLGAAMSLQDTIAQITTLQRAIQDQRRLVNDFLKSNRETMQLVRTELKGSTKGYDQKMIDSLAQAEKALTQSLSSLEQASEALARVRAI